MFLILPGTCISAFNLAIKKCSRTGPQGHVCASTGCGTCPRSLLGLLFFPGLDWLYRPSSSQAKAQTPTHSHPSEPGDNALSPRPLVCGVQKRLQTRLHRFANQETRRGECYCKMYLSHSIAIYDRRDRHLGHVQVRRLHTPTPPHPILRY